MLVGIDVPALRGHDAILSIREKLGSASPPELRADGVLQVKRDGNTELVIVVEVQLATDPNKLYSWPAYVTGARIRYRCEAMLVVLAPYEHAAAWARRPIRLGPVVGAIQPVVVGPSEMPMVVDLAQARQAPELAVFSAIFHGHDKDVSLALRIAQTAVEAALALPDRRAIVYYDLIWAGISGKVKERLNMIPQNYEFQHEGLRRANAEGEAKGKAEGKAMGEAEGLALGLLAVLKARGFPITGEQQQRITSADAQQLRRWLDAAVTAPSVAVALKE
jgi:hypothetical protein